LSFTGSSILPSGVSKRAASIVFLELAQDRRALVVVEPCAFEVGRQRDQQHIDALLVRRPDRLRVRAVQRHRLGIERIPDRGIGVGGRQRVV
jgi:hypothetical protein